MSNHAIPAAHVSELIQLLGEPVLLLSWPQGTKGSKKRWKHLKAEVAMKDAAYLRELEKGNIGVALGDKSGGLISIDWDKDAILDEFIRINPAINQTLVSKGKRGGNVWYRMIGGYPLNLVCLKIQGKSVGEWRSGGAQTIIYGEHPEGHQYQIVQKLPAKQISYDQIVWPVGITPPVSIGESRLLEVNDSKGAESKNARDHTHTAFSNPQSSSEILCPHLSSSVKSVEDCIQLSIPHEPHQNNSALFKFARCIKTLEALEMRQFEMSEHVRAFDRWYGEATSRGVLRSGQSRDQYLMEYLAGYPKVKHLVLETKLLKDAWAMAVNPKAYQPDFSSYFTSSILHRMISWCYYIQHLADKHGVIWWLSCRDAGRYLGVSHTEANQMINTLIRFKILAVVENSIQSKARRFKYTAPRHHSTS
jgi:hypothetical protein